jgi:hypothetical protein
LPAIFLAPVRRPCPETGLRPHRARRRPTASFAARLTARSCSRISSSASCNAPGSTVLVQPRLRFLPGRCSMGRASPGSRTMTEVDLPGIQINTTDLNANPRTYDRSEHRCAHHASSCRGFVELEVLTTQLSDVNQALDIQAIQLHKQAETGCTALTVPPYSSPRRSRMNMHLSQASTSRDASSARRSLALQ